MPQSYPDIQANDLVSASRERILDRDNALKSNFSGTAFPVASLTIGMTCYRTDLSKLYVLESTGPAVWREIQLAALLGTAALKNIGTSGNTVPVLDAANTWSAQQTFGAGIAMGTQSVTTGGGTLSGDADLRLNAGSSKDINFLLNSVSRMRLYANGGLTVGAPTGNSQGAGTINAEAIYVNGAAMGTAATRNTGTGPSNVPLNSDLGSLALKSSVNTSELTDDAVTLAKMAHGNANRAIGYNGSGVPSEITIGTGLSLSSGTLSLTSVGVKQGDLNTSKGSVYIANPNPTNYPVQTMHTFSSLGITYDSTAVTSVGVTLFMRETQGSGSIPTYYYSMTSGGSTLPGGQYGFYPQAWSNWYFSQRYINSSPPIILEDEEAAGFIFLKMNKASREIDGAYIADAPPWLYNGPTYARADYIHDGIKYRHKQGRAQSFVDGLKAGNKTAKFDINACKPFHMQLEERAIADMAPVLRKAKAELSPASYAKKQAAIAHECLCSARDAVLAENFEEITQQIKNADMPLIPHPFGKIDPAKHEVLLVGLYCDTTRDLVEAQNAGAKLDELIKGNYFKIDDAITGKFAPPGTKLVRCKIK